MYDRELFLTTLSGFAATLVREYDVVIVLDELTERVTATLGLVGSGVSLLKDGRLQFVTAVPDLAVELERIQEEQEQGPCLDAARTGQLASVPDLRAEAERWPDYVASAARLGVVSVLGIPLRLEETRVGALNLYSGSIRDWAEEDVAAASVLADMATSYLVNASKLDQHRVLADQLQGALQSRVVIEQAKGMVAQARGLPVDAAFQLIRRHARDNNTGLHAVAEAIVQDGLVV